MVFKALKNSDLKVNLAYKESVDVSWSHGYP